MQRHRLVLSGQSAVSIQYHQRSERLVIALIRKTAGHAVYRKVLAPDQMSAKIIIVTRRCPLCNVLRLFCVQLTRFAGGIPAIIIVNAVGHVRILLDFGDQDPFSDRMDCAGRDIEAIPFVHRYCVQHLRQCIVFDPPGKFLPGDLLPEAVV